MEADGFHTDLQQRVRLLAAMDGAEDTLVSAFTHEALEMLVGAGEATDPRVAVAAVGSPRMHISALDWDDERSVLTAFWSEFSSDPTPGGITKATIGPAFKHLERFVLASVAGDVDTLDESTEAFENALLIRDVWSQARLVRLVLLSNGLLKSTPPPETKILEVPVRFEIWDIERLSRLESSGRTQEPLDIDVTSFGFDGLQALGPFGKGEYVAYLLAIPGSLLASIYDSFGPRLLELNVRAFLQTRVKTNQGMQATLKTNPDRFFAYNNGLSMTAESVKVGHDSNGVLVITELRGLQIVNGGQTTASLFYASRRSSLDLSDVLVQAKLTIVTDEARDELAPLISRFANTQNLIRMADFSANDAFHVELEKLSRSIWAPPAAGTHEMTRWFYERARGQYADALSRARTPAQKRQLQLSQPRSQVFTKTDVAKYENAWSQLPFQVALGAEKNFNEFSQRHAEQGARAPDALYFQHLASKALLWKRTESIIAAMKLGGYRSAVVAYSISLISHRTSMRIDLDEIWRTQDVPDLWATAIETVGPKVHAALVESAGSRNVLEWAKKKDCWDFIQSIAWEPPTGLLSKKPVVASRSAIVATSPQTSLPASADELAGRATIEALGADAWFEISVWAKQTSNLQPWQRSLSFSIGRALSSSKPLSAKQVVQGVKIAGEVTRLGFEPSTNSIL